MVKGKEFTCKCGSSRCKFNDKRIQRTMTRFERRDDDCADDEDEDERRVGEELQLTSSSIEAPPVAADVTESVVSVPEEASGDAVLVKTE